jgi:galactoside O-acetyltransferase
VRIDDFVVLSAGDEGIDIGSYVHIGVYTNLQGKANIRLDDFAGLSSRVSIYSSTDDYLGGFMTNPMLPNEYRNTKNQAVHLMKHVLVGSGTVILPGAVLETGVAIGALCLVAGHCAAFGVYHGNPARMVMKRDMKLLEWEKELAIRYGKE